MAGPTPLPVVQELWQSGAGKTTIILCRQRVRRQPPSPDPDLTRLPRNQSEGDLPQMALMTGGCDAFECLLRKAGIDDAEFTSSSGTGRVHVYQGVNGMGMYQSAPSTTAWGNLQQMMKYDLMINSCECSENGAEKTAPMLQNQFDYANAGGRVFDTHYNYYWLNHGPAPFPTTATFAPDQPGPATATATIDTSFPKGAAFATWLQTVGASTTLGQIQVDEAKYDVDVGESRFHPMDLRRGQQRTGCVPLHVQYASQRARQSAMRQGALQRLPRGGRLQHARGSLSGGVQRQSHDGAGGRAGVHAVRSVVLHPEGG